MLIPNGDEGDSWWFLVGLMEGRTLRVFQINPAPKNPTPLGIAAATRLASQLIGPLWKLNIDVIVNRHEPKQTRLMVRIPAGRSESLRSHPIIPPKTTEASNLLDKSHSNGVRKSSLGDLWNMQGELL